MSVDTMTETEDQIVAHETETLRRYGLRWAVLAGWRDALELRHVDVPPSTDRSLEKARIKLASGCFSACEVGCDLASIESALVSADASSRHNWVDFWVDLLGDSMGETPMTERVLKVPAIKARFLSCGIKGCHCEG